ncbi:Putative reductase YPO4104/y4119/YP_4011 [Sebaldella termitidis]|uniref:Enoyl-[acyl-carrier-protein] reductase [NADH] n=1 Tax=Sebaldella termitidis (strain ATCC 33386 / NCTC 11300) TaxID=526218 RepID=D1AML5_SEBTE|nr:enoyl-ACP reductase FabV [Sebaldella termitidis]ACZ09589.1 Trans-2-enoyl-CoA reductase (NAD(+)) [Sebaldella termitidis ATCC 33386]SUI24919.1 Putative reductase YPO4104/y4119/YP_4011 [Sebaldella termitidis]
MVIKPRLKGSLALTAHPAGCEEFVKRQIDYVKKSDKYSGPKKVLIIGSSSGYGLASRISLAFGAGADTIGVAFEKGVEGKRVGTAGWWNTVAFTEEARKEGLIAKNFMGDAFSDEIKENVIEYIKKEFGGKIDLLIYSLASGVRTDPKTGITYRSALKSTTNEIEGPTINLEKENIENGKMEVATEEELISTVKVMGGEDWKLWIEALDKADVLTEGFKTVAYSYLGPKVTYGIYKEGTIGAAKRDLERTSNELNDYLGKKYHGEAYVSLSKALMTRASAVIPVFPLYAALLYKIMKEKGIHEGTIEQKHRLLKDMIYGDHKELDSDRRLRPDNWEMREDVQSAVESLWDKVTPENFKELTDYAGVREEFMNLNGFDFDNVDYDQDLDLDELAAKKI